MNQTRHQLKTYFRTGAIPLAEHFAALIDSAVNRIDDGIQSADGGGLKVKAGADGAALLLYRDFAGPDGAAGTPEWRIELGDRTDAQGADFSIADGAGTNRLHIDRATGNVGIGTETPTARLTVAGTTTLAGEVNIGGTGAAALRVRSLEGKQADSAEYGKLHLNESSGLDVVVGSDQGSRPNLLVYGNVGIGVLNPTDQLTVAGTTTLGGDVNVGGTGTAALRARYLEGKQADSAGYDKLYLNWHSGQDVVVAKQDNLANLIVNGRVGIGTDAPAAPLQIPEGGAIFGNVTIGHSPVNYPQQYPYETIGLNAPNNLRLTSPQSMFFHTGLGSDPAANLASVRLTLTAAGEVVISPAEQLHVQGATLVDHLLTAREDVHVEGSVGIGNADPQHPLHVTGQARVDQQLSAQSLHIDEDVTIGGSLTVRTDGADRLAVTPAGAVGIGATPTGEELLHVGGATQIDATLTVTGALTAETGAAVTGTLTTDTLEATTVKSGSLELTENIIDFAPQKMTRLRAAYLDGKTTDETGTATLFLNYYDGKQVQIGRGNNRSGLEVFGDTTLNGTLNVIKSATIGETLQVGTTAQPASFALSGAATIGGKLSVGAFSIEVLDDEVTQLAGSRLLLKGEDVVLQGSKVNIITTKPEQLFTVFGDTRVEGNLEATGVITAQNIQLAGDTTVAGPLQTEGDLILQGQLGIGTDAPQAQLHLTENLRLDGVPLVGGAGDDGVPLPQAEPWFVRDTFPDVDIKSVFDTGIPIDKYQLILTEVRMERGDLDDDDDITWLENHASWKVLPDDASGTWFLSFTDPHDEYPEGTGTVAISFLGIHRQLCATLGDMSGTWPGHVDDPV